MPYLVEEEHDREIRVFELRVNRHTKIAKASVIQLPKYGTWHVPYFGTITPDHDPIMLRRRQL